MCSQHRTEVVTLLKSEANLRSSLTPFYLELFNAVARLEGGIKFLVDFRGDLLVSELMTASEMAGRCVYIDVC